MFRHRFPSYRRLMLGAFKWRLRIRLVGDGASAREFTAMADTFDLLGGFPHAGDI